MLFRVIEVRLHPDRAPDFKRRVEFTDSARILIEAGEELLEMDAEDVRTTHVCGILARLDRHPLYHTEFLRQYRELSGCPGMVLKANIQPEIDRLIAYLPDKPYSFSSDPQGVHGRLLEFLQLRKHDPDSQRLFALLASLFVRLDRYDEIVERTRGLGAYAREALREIVANDEVFDDDERTVIRETAQRLLAEMKDVRSG
jgi:hypothetical protein